MPEAFHECLSSLFGDSGAALKKRCVFLLKKADHPGIFLPFFIAGSQPRVFNYLLVKGGRREFDTPNFWTER